MSISGKNPTFFKLFGKPDGKIADEPSRFPADALAKITPGKRIEIEDKSNYGGLKTFIPLQIWEGDKMIDDYSIDLVFRSNGNIQVAIEIQDATHN